MSKASLELGGGNWGTKDGNLLAYAQGNESSKFIPREFTFTRGSDIAATRINSSGLIEKYRENLLLQSNQFDTTWTLNSTSVTSGQSGYDGSSDAWLLNSTTTGFPRIEQLVSASGVSTFSVYAKPATDGFALIRTFGAEATAWFDLINGTITNASGAQYVSSKIQFVGNGWYRCSVTFNGSLTTARIYPASAYGTYSTSGNGVYIQDTQIEKGLVATSYLESGATTVTSGVADNEPRINYAGGTASLLLEPSRTNLIEYSEGILSLSGSATAEYDFTQESPTGLKDGVAFISNIQDSEGDRIQYQGDIVGGNTYTGSMYIKGTSGRSIKYYIKRQGGTYVASVAQTITFDGTWQRIHSTFTSLADNTGARIILLNDSNVNADSCYIWGGQLEEGSYPTSYIPTYGTSVTRNQDQASFSYDAATTSWSVFMDVKNWTDVSNSGQFFFRNIADTTNSLFYYGACFGVQESVGQEYSCGKLSNYEVYNGKFAITYDGVNTVKIYIDGVLRDTITTADTAKTAGIDGGNLYYAGSPASKEIKSLLLFPTTLTDKEAVDLTSPYSTYQELVTAEGLTWESPTCTTNSITELQSI